MGLNERRKIEELQEVTFPGRVKEISFKNGILEMHCAYALSNEGMFSDGEIRQLLEKNL